MFPDEFHDSIEFFRVLDEYESQRPRLEKSLEKLEPYCDKFNRLLEEWAPLVERAERVFSAPPFVEYKLSPEELEEASQAVGYPNRLEIDPEEINDDIRRVREYYTDEVDRNKLGMKFLLEVPEMAENGQYLDALLVSHTGRTMMDSSDSVSLFWFESYISAFKSWFKGTEQKEKQMLQSIGVDIEDLRDGDFEEASEEVAEILDDPETLEEIEQMFAENPELIEQTTQSREQMKNDIDEFVKRDDIDELFLEPEQLIEYSEVINDYLNPVLEEYEESESDELELETYLGEAEFEQFQRELNEAYYNLTRKLVEQVYDAKRRQSLQKKLEEFIARKEQESDKEATRQARLALLELKTPGEEEYFLHELLFHSLNEFIEVISSGKETTG